MYRSIKGKFKFDRIVADVPCSGDGTFRKFSHLWRLFRPRVCLELHLIQLQIAKASALMLKAGGRMIYSTCSINPLEDEAVVAALLLYCGGKLSLVDVEKEGLLPGLKKRAGISDWHIDEEIFTIGEPDDSARLASKSRLTKFSPSMYPPAPEVAAQLHLNRCVRILPHDQDTGGFFVAVLEMVKTGVVPVPYKLPDLITCGPDVHSNQEEVITVDEKKEKKVANGISEARTLQTFKSLGFNAKSRQKEKMKKDRKNNGKDDKKDKMDATRCVLYESLGSSFANAKAILRFDESDLSDGLVGMSVTDSTNLVSNSNIDEISSSCCLVIATSVTVPEIIEKKGADEEIAVSKAEEEKMKIKKLEQKSRDSNGIFGSRSTGWLKVESNNSEEVDEGPSKKVQMVSKCVENALRTWARSDMIIQAGVTVCHHQESSGSWTLEPDGARAFLPHIEKENVILLSPSDFAFFLRIGCDENTDGEVVKSSVIMFQNSIEEKENEKEILSLGVEVERTDGEIFTINTALSLVGREKLWKQSVERLELLESSTSFSSTSVIIAVDDNIDEKLDNSMILESNQQPKRRISKAERKNLKLNSNDSKISKSVKTVHNNKIETEIDSEGTEHKMVLVLTVSYNIIDGSYEGVRINAASSEDVCSSYMAAVLSTRI